MDHVIAVYVAGACDGGRWVVDAEFDADSGKDGKYIDINLPYSSYLCP
jgi:hypothetical protein